MISTRLMLNNVEYIVRAKNKAELNKAVDFLYSCNEINMAELEASKDEELIIQLTNLANTLAESNQEVVEEPKESKFQERLAEEKAKLAEEPKPVLSKKAAPKAKPAPKQTPKRSTPPKDTKNVNLGGMGKPE